MRSKKIRSACGFFVVSLLFDISVFKFPAQARRAAVRILWHEGHRAVSNCFNVYSTANGNTLSGDGQETQKVSKSIVMCCFCERGVRILKARWRQKFAWQFMPKLPEPCFSNKSTTQTPLGGQWAGRESIQGYHATLQAAWCWAMACKGLRHT